MSAGCTTAATCTKVRFATKRKAKLALRRQTTCVRAYRCPVCDWWHLTKHTATEYRRLRRLRAQAQIDMAKHAAKHAEKGTR